jgi:hypothetical protein
VFVDAEDISGASVEGTATDLSNVGDATEVFRDPLTGLVKNFSFWLLFFYCIMETFCLLIRIYHEFMPFVL